MLKIEMVKNCSHVHFVGIGGVSTSALAQWLIANGKKVTGSDKTKSVFTDKLKSLGVQIDFPCGNDLLRGCDFLVTNSAISNDDSEIVLAKKLGKPVFNRSELLGVVFDSFAKNVAVCGMHGKTTTSAMIASCLEFANQKPTAFVGGICKNFNGNFLNGSGDFCVAEACEYKCNFLTLHPKILCMLNLDLDHTDCFNDINDVKKAFATFATNLKSGGVVVKNGDQKEFDDIDGVSFGINRQSDYMATNLVQSGGCYRFCVVKRGRIYSQINLTVPGACNVYNALCAFATLDLIGVPQHLVAKGLHAFGGVERRCNVYKGKTNVVVDYAHHPNEIKCFLQTVAQMGFDKTYLVFQPHTYTRTRDLFDDFAEQLVADEIFVLPTYAARENKIVGCGGQDLAFALQKKGKNATFAQNRKDLANLLLNKATKNDAVLLVGAGDVNEMADLLI